MGSYADLCVYVVRQNFTEKNQISIVQDLEKNRRMKRLGILVNDIKVKKGSGYGYNYGNYDEESHNSLFNKITKIFKKH